ncbi:MAG: hypothetical protein M1829_003101 [Trizodia sp. TS-e1964]|nr:MAG: hypothetical protein M1829_003101 [Trizodia sp. TS-e1964]
MNNHQNYHSNLSVLVLWQPVQPVHRAAIRAPSLPFRHVIRVDSTSLYGLVAYLELQGPPNNPQIVATRKQSLADRLAFVAEFNFGMITKYGVNAVFSLANSTTVPEFVASTALAGQMWVYKVLIGLFYKKVVILDIHFNTVLELERIYISSIGGEADRARYLEKARQIVRESDSHMLDVPDMNMEYPGKNEPYEETLDVPTIGVHPPAIVAIPPAIVAIPPAIVAIPPAIVAIPPAIVAIPPAIVIHPPAIVANPPAIGANPFATVVDPLIGRVDDDEESIDMNYML